MSVASDRLESTAKAFNVRQDKMQDVWDLL